MTTWVWNDFGVIMDTYYLSMSCFSRAHCLIGRVFDWPTSIAWLYLMNSLQSLQKGLSAPEAASSNNSFTQHSFILLYWCFLHFITHRDSNKKKGVLEYKGWIIFTLDCCWIRSTCGRCSWVCWRRWGSRGWHGLSSIRLSSGISCLLSKSLTSAHPHSSNPSAITPPSLLLKLTGIVFRLIVTFMSSFSWG